MEEQERKLFKWEVEKFYIISKVSNTWSKTSLHTWNNPINLENTKIT